MPIPWLAGPSASLPSRPAIMLSRYAQMRRRIETVLYCPLLYVPMSAFGDTGFMGARRARRSDRPKKEPPRLPLFEDRGTPQLRHHRSQLVGDPDNRLAASPLGVLLARRLIAPAEYSADGRYRWLFAGSVRRVGMPFLERPIGPGFL